MAVLSKSLFPPTSFAFPLVPALVFASLSEAAPQFGPAELISGATVGGVRAAASLDVNLDGQPDAVSTANDYGPLRLFLGQNLPGHPFDGGRPVEVAGFEKINVLHVADFDGDGDQDLLIADADAGVVGWLPVVGGAGAFAAPRIITADAHGVEDVATGDIDGDGRNDLVVSAKDRQVIVWFQNLGGGVYGLERSIAPNQYLSSAIELVDVEGDGDLDVLTNSELSGFHWYRNLGGGVFGQQIVLEFRMETATEVAGAVLDGDGDVDFVGVGEVEGETGRLLLYEGDGAGGFSTTRRNLLTGPQVRTATLLDVDDDGDMDIVYQVQDSNEIRALLSGSGTFTETVLFMSSGPLDRLTVADTDGDGRLDLLGRREFFVRAIRSVGPLSFEAGPPIVEYGLSVPLDFVDMTGDGKKDLLFSFRGGLKPSEGGGQFGRRISLVDVESFRAIAARDFDGDGILDLIGLLDVGASSPGLVWSRAVGDGTFEAPVTLPVAPADIQFAPLGVEDLDGDGDLDVYGSAQFSSRTFWIENLGSIWTYHDLPSYFRPIQVLALDLSQDGLAELIAIGGPNQGGGLAVYENLGGGTFGPRTEVLNFDLVVSPASIADLNGDGLLDLAVKRVGSMGSSLYLPNDGQGGFGLPVTIDPQHIGGRPLTALDWDDDGDADIVGFSFGSSPGFGLSWRENLGGSFAAPVELTSSLLSRPDMTLQSSLQFFDLDEDGDLDPVWSERESSPTFGAWRRNLRAPGTSYCTAVPNSTGVAAVLTASGTRSAESNELTLRVSELPQNVFGIFIASQTQGFFSMPGGSLGNICLQGMVSRYARPGEARFSGGSGTFELRLDLTDTPTPLGSVSVLAGDTWNYQAWYRNLHMGATSNFTTALSVTFR